MQFSEWTMENSELLSELLETMWAVKTFLWTHSFFDIPIS